MKCSKDLRRSHKTSCYVGKDDGMHRAKHKNKNEWLMQKKMNKSRKKENCQKKRVRKYRNKSMRWNEQHSQKCWVNTSLRSHHVAGMNKEKGSTISHHSFLLLLISGVFSKSQKCYLHWSCILLVFAVHTKCVYIALKFEYVCVSWDVAFYDAGCRFSEVDGK